MMVSATIAKPQPHDPPAVSHGEAGDLCFSSDFDLFITNAGQERFHQDDAGVALVLNVMSTGSGLRLFAPGKRGLAARIGESVGTGRIRGFRRWDETRFEGDAFADEPVVVCRGFAYEQVDLVFGRPRAASKLHVFGHLFGRILEAAGLLQFGSTSEVELAGRAS